MKHVSSWKTALHERKGSNVALRQLDVEETISVEEHSAPVAAHIVENRAPHPASNHFQVQSPTHPFDTNTCCTAIPQNYGCGRGVAS